MPPVRVKKRVRQGALHIRRVQKPFVGEEIQPHKDKYDDHAPHPICDFVSSISSASIRLMASGSM